MLQVFRRYKRESNRSYGRKDMTKTVFKIIFFMFQSVCIDSCNSCIDTYTKISGFSQQYVSTHTTYVSTHTAKFSSFQHSMYRLIRVMYRYIHSIFHVFKTVCVDTYDSCIDSYHIFSNFSRFWNSMNRHILSMYRYIHEIFSQIPISSSANTATLHFNIHQTISSNFYQNHHGNITEHQ